MIKFQDLKWLYSEQTIYTPIVNMVDLTFSRAYLNQLLNWLRSPTTGIFSYNINALYQERWSKNVCEKYGYLPLGEEGQDFWIASNGCVKVDTFWGRHWGGEGYKYCQESNILDHLRTSEVSLPKCQLIAGALLLEVGLEYFESHLS